MRTVAESQSDANLRYSIALRYIASPTMGLPAFRDALDYVDEAGEKNAREALKACIRTARMALAAVGDDL